VTKVIIKNENITFFKGVFYIMDTFSKLKFGKLIDSTLGQRGSTGKAFQYDNISSSVFCSCLCGADCLEDINYMGSLVFDDTGTLSPKL